MPHDDDQAVEALEPGDRPEHVGHQRLPGGGMEDLGGGRGAEPLAESPAGGRLVQGSTQVDAGRCGFEIPPKNEPRSPLSIL